MYNEDRKSIFFAHEKNSKILDPYQINNLFKLTEPYEEKYNCDVCEWDKEEIIEFLSSYQTTEEGLIRCRTIMVAYTKDMMSAGICKENNWIGISNQEIFQCVDKQWIISAMPTRKELMERLNKLTNPPDKFLILGAFEGISSYGTKNYEFRHVKLSEIDKERRTILLHSSDTVTREIRVSDELIQIAIQSEATYEYRYLTSEIHWQMIPDYILKPQRMNIGPKYDASPDDKYAINLLRRISQALIIAGFPKKVKIQDIRKAGCMDMVHQYIEAGVPRERILDANGYYIDEITNIYGKNFLKSHERFWRNYDQVYSAQE